MRRYATRSYKSTIVLIMMCDATDVPNTEYETSDSFDDIKTQCSFPLEGRSDRCDVADTKRDGLGCSFILQGAFPSSWSAQLGLTFRMMTGGRLRTSADAINHFKRLRRSRRSFPRRIRCSTASRRSSSPFRPNTHPEISHRLLPAASRSDRLVTPSCLHSLAIVPSGEVGHGEAFTGILDARGGDFILAAE